MTLAQAELPQTSQWSSHTLPRGPFPIPPRSSTGYYSYTGGELRTSTFTLDIDEYLAEMRIRQGDITDQITLISNKRTMSFGENGGTGEDLLRPVDLSRKIVGFVGTFFHGALGRLGAISISRNWEIVGPISLFYEHWLRRIVQL